MKTFRLFVAVLFVAAFFKVSINAQTVSPSGVTPKIAVIDTNAFVDEKNGITKFTSAIIVLRKEFEPVEIEIKTLGTRYENLRKEIEGLQTQISKPGSPVSSASIQPKIDEYGKLERDLKFKQEDAKARYQSRYNALIDPIMQDIGKSIQDFARQKGFALIFDGAKLDESGLVLGIGDEKVDVTKDFIAFYNTKPAAPKAN